MFRVPDHGAAVPELTARDFRRHMGFRKIYGRFDMPQQGMEHTGNAGEFCGLGSQIGGFGAVRFGETVYFQVFRFAGGRNYPLCDTAGKFMEAVVAGWHDCYRVEY